MSDIRYWDVFPKSIKVSRTDTNVSIPLSIRGTPQGTPVFAVSDSGIVQVDANGVALLGAQAGAAMIMVYDSSAHTSVRYVQVEVLEPTPPQAVWLPWEES